MAVLIGERMRVLREAGNLTQGYVEKRFGLKRAYISRVEHGHTVPSIETQEKFACALHVPLYHLFYDSEGPPAVPDLPKQKTGAKIAWGTSGKDAEFLHNFCCFLPRIEESDRRLLLQIAQRMASGTTSKLKGNIRSI